MKAVPHGFNKKLEELTCSSPIRPSNELGGRKISGAVDFHEHGKLALGGFKFGDIPLREPNQIGFEALALGLPSLDVRYTGYALPPSASVQR